MSNENRNNNPMIEAVELGKFYGEFAAAQSINFSVPRGQVCAFLGPNGAGKSTTMKMLAGFLAPCEGTARIAGHDVCTDRLEAAKHLGYLPENGPLYLDMTPKSFLTHVGETRCLSQNRLRERLDYVAKTCSLHDVWAKAIGKLSRGYRQRVGMAQALIHDPDVLILDEPTSGLDPNQVRGVRRLIESLSDSKTILLSTHILREVHAMCGRVLLINEGRLVFDGPTSDFGSRGLRNRREVPRTYIRLVVRSKNEFIRSRLC